MKKQNLKKRQIKEYLSKSETLWRESMKKEINYNGKTFKHLDALSNNLDIYGYDDQRILMAADEEVILEYCLESYPRFLRTEKCGKKFSP